MSGVEMSTLVMATTAAAATAVTGLPSSSTSQPVNIPKGKGRRGEGIRSAETRSGQSCAPPIHEHCPGVDSEMLPSSLSDCAFFMEDVATRSYSEGASSGDNIASLSPINVTAPAFHQRRSPDSFNDSHPFLHTPKQSQASLRREGAEDDSDHDEGWWRPRKGTPTPRRALALLRADVAVLSAIAF